MRLHPITYLGRTVALAGAERFWLAPDLDRRPAGDPQRTWVIYMSAYAGDIARGELPGPYSHHDAIRYTRAALIPDRLLHSTTLDIDRAARAFGVPARELADARRDHRRPHDSRRPGHA